MRRNEPKIDTSINLSAPRSRPLRCLVLLGGVPLLLLGAVVFVRWRMPHPQTESDKWLWEKAEKIHELDIDFNGEVVIESESKFGLEEYQTISIKDRQGIRNVLRAFEGTPAFAKLRSTDTRFSTTTPLLIEFDSNGPLDDTIELYKEGDIYYLVHIKGSQINDYAPVSSQSFARFNNALREAVVKARHKQPGYAIPKGGP